jgi:polygalacturonase
MLGQGCDPCKQAQLHFVNNASTKRDTYPNLQAVNHPSPILLALALLPLATASAERTPAAPAQPSIPARTFNLLDYGAHPDGHTSNTEAFHRAVAAVDSAGGGTLVIPAGEYFTGPIELCSALNLHLEAGARLLFSNNFDDYRIAEKTYRPLVGAKNCHDILISGKGRFDGQGDPWWVIERRVKSEARARGLPDAEIGRPRMIVLESCKRIRLEGVTLANSPMYHFVPFKCEDVTVDGISILSPADSPNTDGIDPSVSRRVLITRCLIDTGDDCIAVKAGTHGYGPSEDILVSDCTFLHGHGCSIGSDTDSGVRNMTVERCTFDGTEAGVRLKSRRGRGGLVENITYADLTMRNVGQAIVISSYYYGLPKPGVHDEPQPVTADTPIWRHITVRNVTATGGARDAGLIIGLPEMPARDILLENVTIGARDGLRIAYVDGITLRNVNVTPNWGPSLAIEDTVKNVAR